jgi:insulysin
MISLLTFAARSDVELIKLLTKADMTDFYEHYLLPSSQKRAKLSVHLIAQATSDVSTKQISELVKTLILSPELAAQAATDLQARLSSASHDEEKELAGMKDYLLHDLKVAEDKIDAAVAAWHRISKSNGAANHKLANGTEKAEQSWYESKSRPVIIEDVRTFKSGLQATAGALPVRDLSEYEDLDPKL